MRRLREDEIQTWVQETLLSPTRTRPIVAATSHPKTDRGWVDPEALQADLGDLADVVYFVTGDATWALSEALPAMLDVYGGALRIWWPGLTRTSNPFDHRLYMVTSQAEAERVTGRVLAALRERAGLAPPPAAAATTTATTTATAVGATAVRPARTAPAEAATAPAGDAASAASIGGAVIVRRAGPLEEPERVLVKALARGRVELQSDKRSGSLLEADMPVPVLASCLTIGLELRARPVRPVGDGSWTFSCTGLLPDAWERFAAEARPGAVFTCRVQNLNPQKQLVFVDVLPGVVGVCHVSELDYGHVADLADFAKPGELLPFEVLDFDATELSMQLSRKRAHGQPPQPLPSLVAGGKPFVWTAAMPVFENLRQQRRRTGGLGGDTRVRVLASRAPIVSDAAAATATAGASGIAGTEDQEDLAAQLEAAAADRRELQEKVRELKKELRSAADREQALRRLGADEDPTANERAFLRAVRVWCARQFDEADRLQHPLQRMRVHAQFLPSVRELEGIDADKVVEVCAQVATGMAHTIPAREVHQLRIGTRGAGSRVRTRDGAQAWRCALQTNTPSARRLHWWNVPGPDGAVIEFAKVGLHDDYDIPE